MLPLLFKLGLHLLNQSPKGDSLVYLFFQTSFLLPSAGLSGSWNFATFLASDASPLEALEGPLGTRLRFQLSFVRTSQLAPLLSAYQPLQ